MLSQKVGSYAESTLSVVSRQREDAFVTEARALLAVGGGAAIGGVLRFVITQLVVFRTGAGNAPYATLFINVSGSFLIGIVIELALTRSHAHPLWRLFLATGVLGGYTTFSTFSLEAFTLAAEGFPLRALAYVAGSVVLGIAAAAAGLFAVRAIHA